MNKKSVVVWGTGNVGAPAIRSVMSNPQLELAGVIVHSEKKDGVDAGPLAGIGDIGVTTTRDAEGLLAERPDALVYAVNQDFRPRESASEMLVALRAGVNVVTSGHYGLLHPPSAPAEVRDAFDAACTEGGSTLLSSGIDPGFAMDLLPVVLSGVCAEINEIRIIENFNYATYGVPDEVKAIIGFGTPLSDTPPMILPNVPTGVWGGAIRSLADAIGVEIDEIREVVEKHGLENDVEAAGVRYARGTLGAFRFEVQGISAGHPAIVIEHVTRIVDETAPQWPRAEGMGHHQVLMRGDPNVKLTLESDGGNGDHVAGGNTTAAARITHAIPWVCEAAPGLISGSDLPLIAGRGLLRKSSSLNRR